MNDQILKKYIILGLIFHDKKKREKKKCLWLIQFDGHKLEFFS